MRSYLYVPGDSPAKLAKALTVGADAIIIDLEDAVPPPGKAAARAAVAAFLRISSGPQLWVRVNPGPLGHEDARAVAGPWLAGICVAKTLSAAELVELDGVLSDAERLVGGVAAVVPLLESASAILAAPSIALAPRVARLQIGEADLAADLGVTLGPDERELLWARSHVVLASAAAGIEPPVGPVSTNFRDFDALRESTVALKRLGYRGRACIHPAQLVVVHEVFTPTAAELAAATEVVARHAEALASGSGVCVGADGRLIDEAVVRSARRLLGG
ncbi:citrate lyase subunit beta/citryl-CoA lyase [Allocatelliglobosispora scoriae]|uniref:Citrate lyase subunit beta/citryl-CoA lyase n=1 Tax=Allocatelliglobosispora scoriae TaxID=643052 RepID=A0A841C0B2_9ACTN|nr:CoA ester lyase [Allocatelliglobosispora scoriae]MBB5873375.1 citrate lyase subunit beta/citryl-CoA lyase [Allocatelliglobosispora scoriae]